MEKASSASCQLCSAAFSKRVLPVGRTLRTKEREERILVPFPDLSQKFLVAGLFRSMRPSTRGGGCGGS